MKAAIIGVGRMGRRHIQVVRRLGLDLVGVCDSSPEALALAVKEENVDPQIVFKDAEVLLKNTQPECAIIATTAPSHCEYVCLCAQNGVKQILVEKPMATSLSDCDRMIETCKQNDTRLAVNHQMRFMEQYFKSKEIVYSDSFGGLSSVTVVGGNFGMAMNGTHYFEMFRYMTDEAPVEVTAWFSDEKVPNPRGPQYEDRAGQIRVVSGNAKRLYMDVGLDQGHGIEVIYSGPYGQLIVDELTGSMKLTVRAESYRELPTTRYGMPAICRQIDIQPADVIGPTSDVLNALLTNADFPSGEEGQMAVEVLVAAYVSNELGHKPIRLDAPIIPRNRRFLWA